MIFCMTRAARALEIACDSRKQKLYHLNRPLQLYPSFRLTRLTSLSNFLYITYGPNIIIPFENGQIIWACVENRSEEMK